MGRVIKKGFRELEGAQLVVEERNDLGSRWEWKVSQMSDVPCTCRGNLRTVNLLKHRVHARKAEEQKEEIVNMQTW